MAEATDIQETSRPQPEILHKEFGRYKTTVGNILSLVESHEFYVGKAREFGGEVGDKKFKVRLPHLREGSSAFIGIAEITNPDETTFSFVIRDKTYDAETYQELVKEHPIAKEYMPELYAIMGKWAVIEKLSGLELQEVQEKLKDNVDFRNKCAKGLFELIERTANDGLFLQDFNFMNGHNCMVDPETGQIRLVEQRNLAPSLHYSPNEAITAQLFNELGRISPRAWEPYQVDFAFKLMQIAFSKIKPQDLYIQLRLIGPNHPSFTDTYAVQHFKLLSEEEHKKLGEDYRIAFDLTSHGYTRVFSPDLIEAVTQGDMEKFNQTLTTGRRNYEQNLIDKNDPRSKAIILPDKLA